MEEKILIKNDLGEEKEFTILFTFESNETGKKYVTYTDYEKDEIGNIKCYSGYYKGEKLLPVTTEAELTIIEETLKTITASIQDKYVINKENNE